MACYHPLKGFPIGLTDSGKPNYKITSYKATSVFFGSSGYWAPFDGNPDELRRYGFKVVTDFVEIPCGQCIGCRLEYSRQWAYRCMLELQYHESSYFLTLTYDDDHIIYSHDAHGNPVMTLSKRDIQLFLKRLRKEFSDQKIRYFLCGEYGGKTFRPHYHMIVYGLKLNDLKFYHRNESYNYYNSPTLERIWKNGFVVVGQVTWESCAYTARYIMKKCKGESAVFYEQNNIEPEFTLMSRKPGIARQYFDEHNNIYKYDFINLSSEKGPLKFKPPRYYDRLFDIVSPDEMKSIKDKRKEVALSKRELQLSKTNLTYEDLLLIQERNKERQLAKLKRCIEA